MTAQLYLHSTIRNRFKKAIRTFVDTYTNRITNVFADIEEEAKGVAEEHYNELGQYFHPDYHDAGDFAEQAWEKGFVSYEELSLMQYNAKLMWISTLYQFWEQQTRKFLYDEINKTYTILDKNNNELPFNKFCSKGIGDIKENFLDFNVDIELLSSWDKINELRLLANVIKHGSGWSSEELQLLRPDLFQSNITNYNLLELYKNTLTNIVLNVKEEDISIYGQALVDFWDELPERMYS